MPSIEETPAIKILVVDDDPYVGQMTADFLSSQRYPPVLCNDPNKALEMSETVSHQRWNPRTCDVI